MRPTSGNQGIYERILNISLKEAVSCERAKRWQKVIHNYKRLLRLLARENLPPGFQLPPGIGVLLYETHYHMGIALQQIGDHETAIDHFTKAIEAISLPKNGCAAGCDSNTCMMTPIYTRRAQAYCQTDNHFHALNDADKAVMLDSKNPDVYCIRALTRSTRDEYKEAMKDLATALKLNPRHMCSLIIRGAIENSNRLALQWFDLNQNNKSESNKDNLKAITINPDCKMFLGVNNFKHKLIMTFYDRFLYSLSVPHTISEVHLIPNRPVETSLCLNDVNITMNNTGEVNYHSDKVQLIEFQQKLPFRCGTPVNTHSCSVDEVYTVKRRKDYADAVRKHTARPQTAEEFLAQLQKDHRKPPKPPTRPHTIACDPRARTPVPAKGSGAGAFPFSSIRTNVTALHLQTHTAPAHAHNQAHVNGISHVKVFQGINAKDAPRMYYKPWLGDKLPMGDLPKRQWINPPFK